MANIQSSLKNWSSTAASNQPDSTDAATLTGDLQAIQAGVRYIYSQDTIASATTCDIGSKDAGSLTISGTTTITGLGSVSAGIVKRLLFSGALTLTHNATSLILPGSANITTVAGDTAVAESLGSGNWRLISYTKLSGAPISCAYLPQSFSHMISYPISNTTYRVTAEHVLTVNPTSRANRSLATVDITSSDLTAIQSASAANGRDQSATFAGGLIYCYVISGIGQANALLFSLSETTPTLPTGYAEWARVGPIRWDGTVFGTNYRYNGNLCTIDGGVNVLVNGTATIETSLSLAGYASARSMSYHISCAGTATVDSSSNMHIELSLRSISLKNRAVLRSPYRGPSASAPGIGTWLGQNVEIGNAAITDSFFYLHTITVGSSPLTTITLRAFTYPNGAN